MKQTVFTRLLAVLLLATMLLCSFVACDSKDGETEEATHVDYVAELKLNMNSETVKQEVTVKTFVDGDTTHFYVPNTVMPEGVLKARYIAINTPESTGRIEPWGKAASKFTRTALENATSIIIESDTKSWNADSTGGRYLVWVWYKTADSAEYRNLNLEILQNGLAIASNSAQNRYGETCMKAIEQAKAEKVYVYSTENDPDFYYGAAQELALKEICINPEPYKDTKVAFEGVIAAIYNGSFYVEAFDEENGLYQGIQVYYQTGGLPGVAVEFISVGNKVRVVGTLQYYETGGRWQVSGLSYSLMKPNDPANFQLISKDNAPAFQTVSAEDFMNKKIEVTVTEGEEEKTKTVDYASLLLASSISMNDLKVTKVYTSAAGNTTLDCTCNGVEITVYLAELQAPDVQGKTIDVKGLVDKFDETYQIRILSVDDITIH